MAEGSGTNRPLRSNTNPNPTTITIPSSNFYCHQCSQQCDINRVNEGLECQRCHSDFIEEFAAAPVVNTQPLNPNIVIPPNVPPHLIPVPPYIPEFIQSILGGGAAAGFGNVEYVLSNHQSPQPAHNGPLNNMAPSDPRLRRFGQAVGSERGRVPFVNHLGHAHSGRIQLPIENAGSIDQIIHDLIVGMGGNVQGGGISPVVFLGNPGDYAWGREGLDAIVTNLLNQMDGSGPPPLSTDKIKEIPIIKVSKEQADSLQCSVCWENFKVEEEVRKLSCDHIYHLPCIDPWLQLHGTCPICRKTLHGSNVASGGVGGGQAGEDVNNRQPQQDSDIYMAETDVEGSEDENNLRFGDISEMNFRNFRGF